jgi:hypothetical protein
LAVERAASGVFLLGGRVVGAGFFFIRLLLSGVPKRSEVSPVGEGRVEMDIGMKAWFPGTFRTARR